MLENNGVLQGQLYKWYENLYRVNSNRPVIEQILEGILSHPSSLFMSSMCILSTVFLPVNIRQGCYYFLEKNTPDYFAKRQ